MPVVPKLVRTVTQIKVAIMSYYPPTKNFRISCGKFLLQWLLIILNKNAVWFCVTPRRIAYFPRGVIYPQIGNHCSMQCVMPFVFFLCRKKTILKLCACCIVRNRFETTRFVDIIILSMDGSRRDAFLVFLRRTACSAWLLYDEEIDILKINTVDVYTLSRWRLQHVSLSTCPGCIHYGWAQSSEFFTQFK